MTRKNRIDADDPLKELDKLLRKLSPEQGMVARRNARAAVAAELRRVRTFVDATYPTLTKGKPRRKQKKGLAKVNNLLQQGWVDNGTVVSVLAEAKILPKIIETMEVEKIKIAGRRKKTERTIKRTWTLVPGWAVELLSHPNCTTSMLVRARKSITYRKEALMEKRLWKGEMTKPQLLRLVTHA